jgi:hypothetical protein
MGGGAHGSDEDATSEPVEVYAHRVVLAAGSAYFQGLFTTGATMRTVATTTNTDGTSIQVSPTHPPTLR